jgi:hypothetical protein
MLEQRKGLEKRLILAVFVITRPNHASNAIGHRGEDTEFLGHLGEMFLLSISVAE